MFLNISLALPKSWVNRRTKEGSRHQPGNFINLMNINQENL